jgi:hypothetical protein
MLWHMRTSIDIPDPLLRRARKLARERGVSLKQLFIDGLRAVIERDSNTTPHTMRDRSFGEAGLVDGLSWSDTERMNELVYGERD